MNHYLSIWSLKLINKTKGSFNIFVIEFDIFCLLFGMKIKCYALYDGNKEILSEYANNSQRSFLDYELKDALKRSKKSGRI